MVYNIPILNNTEITMCGGYTGEYDSEENFAKLLAECSIRDGKQRYTEDQIRSMVGAPSNEEDGLCPCGKILESCPDSYVHMSSGV